jgi:hypothetical protein
MHTHAQAGTHEESPRQNPGDHYERAHHYYEDQTRASAKTTTSGHRKHHWAGGLHQQGSLGTAHQHNGAPPGQNDSSLQSYHERPPRETSHGAEINLLAGGEATSIISQATPHTPGSVSSSFRDAGDHISHNGTHAPNRRASGDGAVLRTTSRRPQRPATRASSRESSAEMFLRSRSSLEGDSSRYREHGHVFQSTYRSISSCSFGRDKRKICEHDRKEKMEEKPAQKVIRHDLVQTTKAPPPATFSRAKLGHWSQKPELLDGRWSQQVQKGHHSPSGSPHVREGITDRTAYGNQTMHDFFE